VQDFAGRVAVVTGGASGIGLALARRCAAEGMRVVVGDVEQGALEEAVSALRASGASVEGVATDVSDPGQVQALADRAVERFGAIHLAFNNAGVAGAGLSWEIPLETWQWVLGVNLMGVVHGVRSFVPVLVRQEAGHVVNTASIAGLVAPPFMSVYNASKHAVVALSESLHHELAMAAPHVKVSVLCPGWVSTRIMESERNRPEHLRVAPDAGDPASGAVMQSVLADAMAPDVVAAKVFDAIRDERFWVMTHDDEGDFFVDALDRRLRSVARRTNPELRFGT
jgi:NAD(P)-dependent dehydrogenase (short-subunit alcohol dehydrogenase family)